MFSRFLLTLVLLGLANSSVSRKEMFPCHAMPDPQCFKTDTKTTTQAIGGDIRQVFSNVRVDRAKLAIAVGALGRRGAFHNFNYSLANDVIEGVKMENLDAAADLVCSKLGLILNRDCDSVRSTFQSLAFAEKSTAKLEDFSFGEFDGFKSIYGYVTGVQNSQGDVDIAYTVHQQEFSVEDMEFTTEEIEAIKMHYLKHKVLLNLKHENIIQSISYVN